MTIIANPYTPLPCEDYSALCEAVEGLAWNALTAASLRMLNKPCVPRSERTRARSLPLGTLHRVYPVTAEGVDAWYLLDGAWGRVPETAERYCLDAAWLTGRLDEYVRALLTSGWLPAPGDTDRLMRMGPPR